MLELGVGADLVRGVGTLLWIIFGIALLIALLKPKTIKGKAISILIVLGIFFGPMIPGAIRAHEHKARYDKAKALFDERCKTAGLKIYKTVQGVDSLFLTNIHKRVGSETDPMALSAASWQISDGEWYIRYFLFDEEPSNNPYGYSPVQKATDRPGFKFVEAIDPLDGERYRYTWRPGEDLKRERSSAGKPPRYAIEVKDHLIPDDRAHWIASSSLKITDTQSGEAMAEMLYYKFETGLGSRAGQRQPWAFAISCPNAPVMNSMHRLIANKVLRTETQVKK
jgi:hypothetical protein